MTRGVKNPPIPKNAQEAVKYYKYDTNWEMKCGVADRKSFICCDLDGQELGAVLEANRACLTCATRKPPTSVVPDFPREYFTVMRPNAQGLYCCFLLAAYVPIADDLRAPSDMGDADAELYDLMVRCFFACRLMQGAVATAKASDDILRLSLEHWAEQARSIVIIPLTYVSFLEVDTPFFNIGLALGRFLLDAFEDKEELPHSFQEIYDRIVASKNFYKVIGMGTATPGPTVCARCKCRKDRRHKTRPCLRYTNEPCCLACRAHRRTENPCFAVSSSDNDPAITTAPVISKRKKGRNSRQQDLSGKSSRASRKRKGTYTAIKSQHRYAKRKRLEERTGATEGADDASEGDDDIAGEVDELVDDDEGEVDELFDDEDDEVAFRATDGEYEPSAAEGTDDDIGSWSYNDDEERDKTESFAGTTSTQAALDRDTDFDANLLLDLLARRDELIVNEFAKLHRMARLYEKKQERLSRELRDMKVELHDMKVDRDRLAQEDVVDRDRLPQEDAGMRDLSPELGPPESDAETDRGVGAGSDTLSASSD